MIPSVELSSNDKASNLKFKIKVDNRKKDFKNLGRVVTSGSNDTNERFEN